MAHNSLTLVPENVTPFLASRGTRYYTDIHVDKAPIHIKIKLKRHWRDGSMIKSI